MARRVEPDPETWWDHYGHRLEAPPGPSACRSRASRPGAAELTEDAIVRAAGRAAAARLAALGALVDRRPDRPRARSPTSWPAGRCCTASARPLPGAHRVAVTSIKGGVGKTTVAACLGLVLAEHRGDRVVALDANPDAGTLADRLTGESA